MNLREAKINDAKVLLYWRNDPVTRNASFNHEYVQYDTHIAWLADKLSRPDCHILIGTDKGKLVGTVRFDVDDNVAAVSVVVDPHCRRKGYGAALIEQGVQYMASRNVTDFDAYVLIGNLASEKTFESSGFGRMAVTIMHGMPAIHYRRKENQKQV